MTAFCPYLSFLSIPKFVGLPVLQPLIHLSNHSSTYSSTHPPAKCLSPLLTVCHPTTYPPTHPSTHPPIHPPIHPSLHPPTRLPSLHSSTRLSIHPPIQKLADLRVRRCTELLQNIKCLKLYAWEETMATRVEEARNGQLKAMMVAALLKALTSG